MEAIRCPVCRSMQTNCVGKSEKKIGQTTAAIAAFKCQKCRAEFKRTVFPGAEPPLDELLDDRD